MNSTSTGARPKKSRANGSSLYMYSQTPHEKYNRNESSRKKDIRSYSSKKETFDRSAKANEQKTNCNIIGKV